MEMLFALLRLLSRALHETISQKGSTLLATAIGLIVSAIQQLIALSHGKQAMNEKLKDWKSYIGIGLTFVAWALVFLFTTARIVYDDHRSAVNKPCANAPVVGPSLKPHIQAMDISPGGDKNNSEVWVGGTIDNTGEPGSFNEIGMYLTFPDGHRVYTRIRSAGGLGKASTFSMGKNVQGQPIAFSVADYWLNHQSDVIPRFGHLNGWIVGLAEGVNFKEAHEKHVTITLWCTDITGRPAWDKSSPIGTGISLRTQLGLQGLQQHLPSSSQH
jgi:hypothetical protein